MPFKKEMILLYLLVLLSVGYIIAAEPSINKPSKSKPALKPQCCTKPGKTKSGSPLNFLSQSMLHVKA